MDNEYLATKIVKIFCGGENKDVYLQKQQVLDEIIGQLYLILLR